MQRRHNAEVIIIHRHHNPFMKHVIMTMTTIVMTTEGVEDITKSTKSTATTGTTGEMIAGREW